MFSKTLSSVDYNKTSAEWNYVHEDLKESVVGVMYWIPLLLWNVSCWEDPGCEAKASVERPLLSQGQSRGPGRGSLCGGGGLSVLVLKRRLCCICASCASLAHRGWVVCGFL